MSQSGSQQKQDGTLQHISEAAPSFSENVLQAVERSRERMITTYGADSKEVKMFDDGILAKAKQLHQTSHQTFETDEEKALRVAEATIKALKEAEEYEEKLRRLKKLEGQKAIKDEIDALVMVIGGLMLSKLGLSAEVIAGVTVAYKFISSQLDKSPLQIAYDEAAEGLHRRKAKASAEALARKKELEDTTNSLVATTKKKNEKATSEAERITLILPKSTQGTDIPQMLLDKYFKLEYPLDESFINDVRAEMDKNLGSLKTILSNMLDTNLATKAKSANELADMLGEFYVNAAKKASKPTTDTGGAEETKSGASITSEHLNTLKNQMFTKLINEKLRTPAQQLEFINQFLEAGGTGPISDLKSQHSTRSP